MSKLNLPNKLTLLRILLVPPCMAIILLGAIQSFDLLSRILGAALFLITSLTDMLDGMIARKHNLITDFGKLMDPLADKMLVLGVLLASIGRASEDAFLCFLVMGVTFIVLLRELAVTSLRLVVASKSSIVVAANWMGKAKTVTQIVTVMVLLLEPIWVGVLYPLPILGYITLAAMTFLTVASGLNYFKAYWPAIDPTK